MLIQVLSHQFIISEPFAEGHRLTAEEAQALNMTRADRLRNIIYKRLSRGEPESIREFEQEVQRIDRGFQFTSHASRAQSQGPKASIMEVARERANEEQARGEIKPRFVEERARDLAEDPAIQAEGGRRYELRQRVAQEALNELLGIEDSE